MKQSKNVKIVVFVPESHTDIIREAIGKVSAGKIGNYTYCSFSSKGIGRFKPEEGAHPNIGEVGKFESVQEERIEFVCERNLAKDVIPAIKKYILTKKSHLTYTHWRKFNLYIDISKFRNIYICYGQKRICI